MLKFGTVQNLQFTLAGFKEILAAKRVEATFCFFSFSHFVLFSRIRLPGGEGPPFLCFVFFLSFIYVINLVH